MSRPLAYWCSLSAANKREQVVRNPGAASVSAQIATAASSGGFCRGSICAQSAGLAPASHKRAAGDVYAPPGASGFEPRTASMFTDLGEAAKAPISFGSTLHGCRNRWECALRFYVKSRAAAVASLKHWHS